MSEPPVALSVFEIPTYAVPPSPSDSRQFLVGALEPFYHSTPRPAPSPPSGADPRPGRRVTLATTTNTNTAT